MAFARLKDRCTVSHDGDTAYVKLPNGTSLRIYAEWIAGQEWVKIESVENTLALTPVDSRTIAVLALSAGD
jgi:hypothetical protein